MIHTIQRQGKTFEFCIDSPESNESIIDQYNNSRGAWVKCEVMYNQKIINYTKYLSDDLEGVLTLFYTSYLYNNDMTEKIQSDKDTRKYSGGLYDYLGTIPQTRETSTKRAINGIFTEILGVLPVFNPTTPEMEIIQDELLMQPYYDAMQLNISQNV